MPADPETPLDPWSWLAGTFWYVPAETMLAIRMIDLRRMRTAQIQDQTLWHIEQYISGYLIGRSALSLDGGAFSTASMVGSVTPAGEVLLSFAPLNAVSVDPETGIAAPALTMGTGKMVRYHGQWAFLMQMSSGTGAMSLTHWSDMVQSTPDEPSWTAIRGVPGTSIGAVFANPAISET